MGKASDHACAHLKCPKNKETPSNDNHILLFIISVFISFSYVHVGNSHHPLYLSSIYRCCQCLQCDLNGSHHSVWVIVGRHGLDKI